MSNLDLIIQEMQWIKKAVESHELKMDSYIHQIETRLRNLEDWRLAFVTKFTTYSAIAMFLGTIIAQAGLNFLTKLL